jgi:flagellar motor switch protein FliG
MNIFKKVNGMRKIKRFGLCLALLAAVCGVASFAQEVSAPQLSLLEQEHQYEKEKAEYLQTFVLDKILGQGKAIVIVEVELGIETKTTTQAAKQHKAEKKKDLGDVDYLLPGVPNPKSVSQETAPGESKEESGAAEEVKVESRTVIRKQAVTVLHDDKIAKERLDVVRDAIIASLRLDPKRDKLEFKKTKFTRGFMEELLRPQVLIPVTLALLIIFFLFGPLASFLRSYVRTMKERSGTEISMDSKFEGGEGGENGKGGGGGGALTPGEIEAIEKEKKKYHPFEYITDDNLKRMVYLVRKEPAQTIALVVSYLKPEYVREVLNALTPELQVKVALEMATIRSMTQEQVQAIDNGIKEKIEFLVGGIYHLLEVLDQVDKVTQNNILDYLRDEKPELYEKVRKYIIAFEDIANFPDPAMQTIIRELKTQDLAQALRDAPSEIMSKFFSNMSANAAAILKEEMEYGRPLKPEEIADVRKKILATIKQLEADGKVYIREKPKTDVLEGFDAEESEGVETADSAGFEQYYNAGVQFYDTGNYTDALSYFEYCVQLDQSQPALYQYLGNSYYALGRAQEAVGAFEKALELNPDDEQLRGWLAEQKNTISQ